METVNGSKELGVDAPLYCPNCGWVKKPGDACETCGYTSPQPGDDCPSCVPGAILFFVTLPYVGFGSVLVLWGPGASQFLMRCGLFLLGLVLQIVAVSVLAKRIQRKYLGR